METTSESNKAIRAEIPLYLRASGLIFPFLLAWAVMRGGEIYLGHPLLSLEMKYFIGLGLWFLLLVYLAKWTYTMKMSLALSEKKAGIAVSWCLFLGVVAGIVYFFGGYRILAILATSSAGGLDQTRSLAFYALLKHYPEHPFVPFLVMIKSALAPNISTRQLAVLLWSRSQMEMVVVGCTVAGFTFLVLAKGVRFRFLVFTLCSGLLLLLMKRPDLTIDLQVRLPSSIALHGLVVFMLLWLALNTYSFCRRSADKVSSPAGRKSAPPHWLLVGLILFVLLPIFSDVHNQYVLAKQHRQIVKEIAIETRR